MRHYHFYNMHRRAPFTVSSADLPEHFNHATQNSERTPRTFDAMARRIAEAYGGQYRFATRAERRA